MKEFKYYLKWILQDENGDTWEEEYESITLDEFEELYGATYFRIIKVEMWIIKDSQINKEIDN